MKATKRIVLLLALNKLRKRKILFHRKMKHLLLTFTLFMQKQGYSLLFRICIASAPNSENSSPTLFIRWSTMSKGGLKKRLLERMNQFSRSFGKTEVATGVFFKKRYSLEISQNSWENTCARAFFKYCRLCLRETLAQAFSWEFCEISKNTFFTEHLWATTASGRMNLECLHPRLTSLSV